VFPGAFSRSLSSRPLIIVISNVIQIVVLRA
jgi:hypothetical protein